LNLPAKRKWALLALVPAVLLVAAGADRDEKGKTETVVAEAAPKAKLGNARMEDASGPDPAQLQRPAELPHPANAFESKTWYVPPPPPPPAKPLPPAPPPPPVAPPLPFTYLGQYLEKDMPVIFLVQGDRVLTVKQGDVIDGAYRVDGIVGASLGLTYLPLNIKQILNIGTAG
jgi:hypothetical protein